MCEALWCYALLFFTFLCNVGAFAKKDAPTGGIAILSNHDPKACNSSNGNATSACNLRVYVEAIRQASAAGAVLVLLPEAYGLEDISATPEPMSAVVGARMCENQTLTDSNQRAVACAADKYSIDVVANFFVRNPNDGIKHITDIVFDANGIVRAIYEKSHLFPTERLHGFSPGPKTPRAVTLNSDSFGLAICYEGLYPILSGDWSQFEKLKQEGAGAILWSIGGILPDVGAAKAIIKRYNFSIFAAELNAKALATSRGGRLPTLSDVPLDVDGYSANASVEIFGVKSEAL